MATEAHGGFWLQVLFLDAVSRVSYPQLQLTWRLEGVYGKASVTGYQRFLGTLTIKHCLVVSLAALGG